MSKKMYSVQGTEVATLKEVAEIVGRRVSGKDVEEGKIPGVKVIEAVEDVEVKEAKDFLDAHIEVVPVGEATKDVTEDEEDEEVNEAMANDEVVATEEDKKDDVKDMSDEDIATKLDTELAQEPTEDVKPEEAPVEEVKEDVKPEPVEEPVEEVKEEPTEEAPKTTTKSTAIPADLQEKLKAITKPAAPKKQPVKKELALDKDGNIEYPEKGDFTEPEQLKKYYKNLTNDQLQDWLELEGLEYKHCDTNEAINRMRMCMSMTSYHFPKAKSAKKKSKYAQYTNEQLVQMCLDNDIEVKDAKGDMRILRMYSIMALRKAGLLD